MRERRCRRHREAYRWRWRASIPARLRLWLGMATATSTLLPTMQTLWLAKAEDPLMDHLRTKIAQTTEVELLMETDAKQQTNSSVFS